MLHPVPALRGLGHPPQIGVRTAVRLVGQHAGHLGITVDEMAAVLRTD
jgi:hypothetical protein